MRVKLKPVAYGIMLAIAHPLIAQAVNAASIPDFANANGASATFSANGANTVLDVGVSKANSVINWNGSGFNVGTDGTVNFNSSVGPTSILNYDNSGAMSNIQGIVNNGGNKLFLVNPNGISDSSGAFTGLISNDAANVTLDTAGKLNIINKGNPLVDYGSVTGSVSKASDVDVVMSNGSGSSNGKMILGGNHATITVENDGSPLVIDSDNINLQSNQTAISSGGGGGDITLRNLKTDNVSVSDFTTTNITGEASSKNLSVKGFGSTGSSTLITTQNGKLENVSVTDSSLNIEGVEIIGLKQTATDANLVISAATVTGADVTLKKGSSDTQNNITINGGSQPVSVSGSFTASNKIAVNSNASIDSSTFSGFKELTIKDRTTGFSNVTANAANPASTTIITNSTGTISSYTQNGGVLDIESNVSGGVLTFDSLVHHAYVGGGIINVSNGSTVNLNSADITYNSDDDINTDTSLASEENVSAGATNSFVATAKGTGGNLNVTGGNIYAEKSIKFIHEEGAGGNLSLSRADILSKEADIELIKNTSFTTTKEDGENSVELASDSSTEAGNKGVIIIDDQDVKDGVTVAQGKSYTTSEQNSGSDPWGEKSSDNRIAIDWANTSLDRTDIKEGKALFASKAITIPNPNSDGGEGGSDNDGSGTGTGGGTGGTTTPPTDPGAGDTGTGTTQPGDGTDTGTGTGSGTGTGTGAGTGTGTGTGNGTGTDTGTGSDTGTGTGTGTDTGNGNDTGTGSGSDTGTGTDTGSGTGTDTGTGGESGTGADGSGSGSGSGSAGSTGSGSGSDTGVGGTSPIEPGGSGSGTGTGTGTTPADPGAGNEQPGTGGSTEQPSSGSGSGGSDSNGSGSTDSGNEGSNPVNPGTGQPVDPDTGLPTYPDLTLPTDPATGLPSTPGDDSQTDTDNPGQPETSIPGTNPSEQPGNNAGGDNDSGVGAGTGTGSGAGSGTGENSSNPGAGGSIDPGTGWPIDEETGWPIDPETGIPTEPGSNHNDSSGSSSEGESQAGSGQGQNTAADGSDGKSGQDAKSWSLREWASSIFGNNSEDEKKRKKKAAQDKARAAKAKIDMMRTAEIKIMN